MYSSDLLVRDFPTAAFQESAKMQSLDKFFQVLITFIIYYYFIVRCA